MSPRPDASGIKMGKRFEEMIARLVPLVFVTTTCLQNPGTDPFGNTVRDPTLEQVWTIILTGDSGRVWIAQSDTLEPAGATPTATWSRLNYGPRWMGTGARRSASVDSPSGR